MSDAITVLLVDEDRDILDLTTTFLERADEAITVTTETETNAALETIEAGGIDCVISDYSMPGMTGVEFLDAVRERDPELPFFMFTGRDRATIEAELGTETIDGYVQKGASTDQYTALAADIRDVVNG